MNDIDDAIAKLGLDDWNFHGAERTVWGRTVDGEVGGIALTLIHETTSTTVTGHGTTIGVAYVDAGRKIEMLRRPIDAS